MKSYQSFKQNLLQDEEIKKEYDLLKAEYDIIDQMIATRIQKGLTQKKLASLTGTTQSAISRFEHGAVSPSIEFLSKIATAFGKKLIIDIR